MGEKWERALKSVKDLFQPQTDQAVSTLTRGGSVVASGPPGIGKSRVFIPQVAEGLTKQGFKPVILEENTRESKDKVSLLSGRPVLIAEEFIIDDLSEPAIQEAMQKGTPLLAVVLVDPQREQQSIKRVSRVSERFHQHYPLVDNLTLPAVLPDKVLNGYVDGVEEREREQFDRQPLSPALKEYLKRMLPPVLRIVDTATIQAVFQFNSCQKRGEPPNRTWRETLIAVSSQCQELAPSLPKEFKNRSTRIFQDSYSPPPQFIKEAANLPSR